MGFLSSFWAHLSQAVGTRAQCASRVQGSTTNPCLVCGRSLETLESPPPALELSEDRAPGVGSSVSMMPPIGVPCKPGSGRGASHSGSGSSRSRGVRGPPGPCASPGAQQTTRPSSKQRRLCGSGETAPQCWYQAGWFQEPRPRGGQLKQLFPLQLQGRPGMGGAPHPRAPRMGPNHGASISEGTALGSLRPNAEGAPAGHPPCPPRQRKGAHPRAHKAHEAPGGLQAASWPNSVLVLSPKSLFFQTLSKSVLIHQKRS